MNDVQEQAQKLFDSGYCCLSNKYRIVARIDREDWLEYLAGQLRRSVMDFYIRTPEGVTDSTGRWGEYYCALYSKDRIEGVHYEVYVALKRLWRQDCSDVTYREKV